MWGRAHTASFWGRKNVALVIPHLGWQGGGVTWRTGLGTGRAGYTKGHTGAQGVHVLHSSLLPCMRLILLVQGKKTVNTVYPFLHKPSSAQPTGSLPFSHCGRYAWTVISMCNPGKASALTVTPVHAGLVFLRYLRATGTTAPVMPWPSFSTSYVVTCRSQDHPSVPLTLGL